MNEPKSSNRPTNRAVFILLIVLSLGGVAIMEYSVKYGSYYWLAMAVIFGAASVGMAWHVPVPEGTSRWYFARRQILHWLTLVGGILLVFFLQRTETMEPADSGLMALLMLTLTTILAGVHFQWRMAVLGGMLAVAFVASVLVDRFFWVMLVVTVVLVAMDIWIRARNKKSTPQD